MKNQSLQEQLLKAGLVSETKAKHARAEKRKQNKQQRNAKVEAVDEAKQQLQHQRSKQAERDKELNQQRKEIAERQEIAGQVKQLIERHRLAQDCGDDGIAYHFNDRNKVKTLYLDPAVREKIIAGKLAIVRLESRYEVVPAEIAEKIKVRDAAAVVVLFSPEVERVQADEYADYKIPDDLMW